MASSAGTKAIKAMADAIAARRALERQQREERGRSTNRKGKRAEKRQQRSSENKGNIRVQERTAFYAPFQGGKAGNEVYDVAGKAWACGLFDGHGADAIAMRDAVREFATLFKFEYAYCGVRTSNLERSSRSTNTDGNDQPSQRELRYRDMKEVIGWRSLPRARAFYALAVDYLDSDDMPPFIRRLINERRAAKGLSVAGILPIRGDQDRWNQACDVIKDLLPHVVVRSRAA